MKSILTGLVVSIFSFQVFAVNNLGPGTYIAYEGANKRLEIELAPSGAIPRLILTVLGVQCNGRYQIVGDEVKAIVNCAGDGGVVALAKSAAIKVAVGDVDTAKIPVIIRGAGATTALLTSASGARVSLDVNDGGFEHDYQLKKIK